jgi:hypothetical protein
MKLENWSMYNYKENDTNYVQMIGEIHNDYRGEFKDGDIVLTSFVKELNLEKKFVVTRNSAYHLGKMSEKFQKNIQDNNVSLKSFTNNK